MFHICVFSLLPFFCVKFMFAHFLKKKFNLFFVLIKHKKLNMFVTFKCKGFKTSWNNLLLGCMRSRIKISMIYEALEKHRNNNSVIFRRDFSYKHLLSIPHSNMLLMMEFPLNVSSSLSITE